ncbi:MAG: hypothetical protein EBZ77_17105, partial [Chitinophagia bacterium]|nr:hypothetical protein [Chitinophagia bacterium]
MTIVAASGQATYAVIEMCNYCAAYSVLDSWVKTRGEADSYGNVDITFLEHGRKAELVLYGPRKLWPLSALIWGEELERVNLLEDYKGRKLNEFADFRFVLQDNGFSI